MWSCRHAPCETIRMIRSRQIQPFILKVSKTAACFAWYTVFLVLWVYVSLIVIYASIQCSVTYRRSFDLWIAQLNSVRLFTNVQACLETHSPKHYCHICRLGHSICYLLFNQYLKTWAVESYSVMAQEILWGKGNIKGWRVLKPTGKVYWDRKGEVKHTWEGTKVLHCTRGVREHKWVGNN